MVRNLRLLLPLSPPRGREVDFPNHGKGSAMLPLVRVRIVFCYVFSSFDPLFPGFVFSPLHPGVILEKDFGFCRMVMVVPAPPSLAFFCHLFFFSMASGGWRTIVDISTLNLLVVKTLFF